MKRIINPELLDHLDPSDSKAVRGRWDLAVINLIMSNENWFIDQLKSLSIEVDTLIELGAGEGLLLTKIHHYFPNLRLIGCDFISRPEGLHKNINWIKGNFLEHINNMPISSKTIIIANLVLHHFDKNQLEIMRIAFSEASSFIIVEPYRSLGSLALAYSLFPFLGTVTRSDIITSIRAGFIEDELETIFRRKSLTSSCWLGGLRLHLI